MTAKTELQTVAGTKSADRAADIVFVHGLDGDKRETWQHEYDENSFWPKLLYNDVPTCGVWSFGYDARSSEWIHGGAMPIVDRASNFAAFLRSEGLGDKPIFFIVHSLGGLIVKQMLRSRFDKDQDDPIVRQTRGIFFFATPHGGSDVSKLVQWLKFYRPSVLVKELESAAAPLRDLNMWYRGNCSRLNIETTVFFETQTTAGKLIVDQLSSDPGVESAELIPIDANHVEICKVDTDSMPYKTIRNSIESFIRNQVNEIELTHGSSLWMDVGCFNKYPDQWEEKNYPKSENRIVKYNAVSDSDSVKVSPQLPYLDAARRGDPVWAIPYMWQPFRWLPLNLDFKFLNQSEETLYLTALSIRVKRSVANREPILFLKHGTLFPCICISNDGWSNISEPSLQIAIHEANDTPSFPQELPISVPISEFSEYLELDLTEQFKSLGVDVDAVMHRSPNPNVGPFQSRIIFIFGQLNFIDESGESRVFRFGTDMRIEGPLMGMYGPPTFEYKTRLQAEGENYVRTVEISHVLKAGESDRFLLQLDVDRTSNHELEISVESNRGRIATSKPMQVSLFVPRSVNEQVSDLETKNPFFFK